MNPIAPTAVVALAIATSSASASVQTFFFDFGNDSQPTIGNYNNVSELTVQLNNIIDDSGAASAIDFEMDDPFFNNGPPSQIGSEAPAGDAAIFPVSATDDYLFGHTGAFAGGESNPTGGFVLSGLNDAFTYNLTFFGSRTGVNDNRETRYTVNGVLTDTGLLGTSNNDTEVLNFLGVSPSGGEISVSVEAGPNNDNANQFYYMGALRLQTIPAPATGAPILAAIALLARRRRG